MSITRAFIISGKSIRGGWSKEQLSILGIDWPPLPGWLDKAAACKLSAEEMEAFLKGKGK